MADQRSRGGKKEGTQDPGHSEQHQKAHTPEAEQAVRPGPGQPGGPKQSEGKTRHPSHQGND